MDTTDSAVRRELERRLEIIGTEEAGDPTHGAFPRTDLIVLLVIVVASVVVAVIAGL